MAFQYYQFRKTLFSDEYFKIILLFKKNAVPQTLFPRQLQDL